MRDYILRSNQSTRRNVLASLGAASGVGIGTLLFSRYGQATPGGSVTLVQCNRNTALRGEDEYCTISTDLLRSLNVDVGDQLRVGSHTRSATYESGLYTIIGTRNQPDTVGLSKSGLDRLGLKNKTDGFVRNDAPHPNYETRHEADVNDEFVEILADDGEESGLVACAPHGGWIEYPTDKQSQFVATELDVTEWACVGYNSGGGAFDRWHITSTDISRHSFPKLDSIGDRQFTHAVSFHGFTNDGIGIGGAADESLRIAVRDEIAAATDGKYDVYLADDGPYDGDSPDNFVNWLTRDNNGVQIEQSWTARTDDWDTIADAVARVYAGRL